MTQAFIVLGDRTSHGGTVISADMTCSIDGKYIARVGDSVVCPRCKGVFRIATGASDALFMGQAGARHGDTTDCGATLLASQSNTTWSADSDLGDPAADERTPALSAATQVAAATDSGICLDCLIKAAQAGNSVVIRD